MSAVVAKCAIRAWSCCSKTDEYEVARVDAERRAAAALKL